MAVDSNKFAEVLEEMLISFSMKRDVALTDLQEDLKNVCRLFGIIRLEVATFDAPERVDTEEDGSESQVVKNILILYREMTDDGKMVGKNESRKFKVRDNTKESLVEYDFYQKDGEEPWEKNDKNKMTVIARIIHSAYQTRHLQRINEELTLKDQELDMFNELFFINETDRIIKEGRIGEYNACYFNIKRFTTINQQLGRQISTQILQIYIVQLQRMLSDEEFICRISGDDFVVLFLKPKMKLIKEYLKEAIVVYDEKNRKRIKVESSAGCYIIPENTKELTASEIMNYINTTAEIASEHVEPVFLLYSEELIKEYQQSKRIIGMFQEALEKEEFLVYYQPKIALDNYRLLGAEALCRWYHDGELVPPDDFIPILEQGKAICDLDFYMLEHVCQDIRKWMDEGKEVVKVSVNLSRRHMTDIDLLEHILTLIDSYEIPHEYIEIELTETTTDVEFRDLKKIVSGLQKEGISTSVDDFGVGYSSLNLIRELPWDVLKIDKSFLPSCEDKNSQKYLMFKHLVAMAQDMGLECIVEGVETLEQVQLLKKNNCFLAQGFYFDRPLPSGNFEERLMAALPENLSEKMEEE